MNILVTTASKHGSALGVGERIGEVLQRAGHAVTFSLPEQVSSLDGYDSVVIGSAVYLTQWMPAATDFVKRFERELRELPVWAFSVGLAGVPKGTVQDPSRVGPVLLEVAPVSLKTFAGRLDTTQLNLRERSIARLGGAVEGDFRNWDEVETFAQGIVDYLNS
ncbi:flavodoxin domain-containing protein [Actinomycetaceae bacterium TAE3-ERU4]|nr:flavodoxin domain-containing protein [Actinomycetaceae bacterium TAE3-ERU4]